MVAYREEVMASVMDRRVAAVVAMQAEAAAPEEEAMAVEVVAAAAAAAETAVVVRGASVAKRVEAEGATEAAATVGPSHGI